MHTSLATWSPSWGLVEGSAHRSRPTRFDRGTGFLPIPRSTPPEALQQLVRPGAGYRHRPLDGRADPRSTRDPALGGGHHRLRHRPRRRRLHPADGRTAEDVGAVVGRELTSVAHGEHIAGVMVSRAD